MTIDPRLLGIATVIASGVFLAGCKDDAKQETKTDIDKNATNNPPAVVAEPCKIRTIQIVSVEYLSDHKLLKDYDTDWADGGSRYPKPEWTDKVQHPVSHTMDQQVKLKVTLEVGPPGCAPETGSLKGVGPGGLTFELKNVTFKPGQIVLEMTSDKKLEKKVQELEFAIDWTVSGTAATLSPARTSNRMFVTIDTPTTPTEPGVTLKRMRQAVTAVGGAASLDPHKIVAHIMARWGSFNLQAPYNNAWELADSSVGGDCQTIVRYTQNVIKMVGCPGLAEAIVVWAKVPTPATGQENAFPRPNVSDPPQWHNDFRPPVPARARWMAALVDGGGGLNRYEACLRFTHGGVTKYYPGGVRAIMDNANQVIQVFSRLSWIDMNASPLAERDVIHRYR